MAIFKENVEILSNTKNIEELIKIIKESNSNNYTLCLRHINIGIKNLIFLLESPCLSKISNLILSNIDIGSEGARAIAKSKTLKNLRGFDLDNNQISLKKGEDILAKFIEKLKNKRFNFLSNNLREMRKLVLNGIKILI